MIVELNIADDTLGFVYENLLEQTGVDEIKKAIEKKLEVHQRINIYLEEDDVDEIELRAFLDHVVFDIIHADRIRKVAIVSNRKWIRGMAKIKDLIVPTEVKAFASKDRVDALCWVVKIDTV